MTEIEKQGLRALAPLAGRPTRPSVPTSGGWKSGKPIAQANIQLGLPEFDPKSLPEWAEEFANVNNGTMVSAQFRQLSSQKLR